MPMRQPSGIYLESTVRTDLVPYDSLKLIIKGFIRNRYDSECTHVTLRYFKRAEPCMTIHGNRKFAKLTEYDINPIATDNSEICTIVKQIIATRDYKLIGVMFDRMIDLELIPSLPYWFRQWCELVTTYCTEETVYRERLRFISLNNTVYTVPDIKVNNPNYDIGGECGE